MVKWIETRRLQAHYPNGPITQEYKLLGVKDYTTALSEFLARTPLWYSGLPRDGIQIDRDDKARDADLWIGTATWVLNTSSGDNGGDDSQPTFVRYNFTTHGTTGHVCVPIKRRGIYVPDGADKPKLAMLVGADGDKVEGVDIELPGLEWSETWHCPAKMITNSYVQAVALCSKCTNANQFRAFPTDEVFFRGLQGSAEVGKTADLDFCFVAGPTVKNLKIDAGGGKSITIKEKKAWDYIWAITIASEDAGQKIQKITAAIVDQMYGQANYSAMKIG